MARDGLAERVMRWQAVHGRQHLPWQASRDPYRVWLSEVMLQQTQVATVLGYFERFTTRFPTVAELAAASEDEVLALWSGLGYYARARNLLRCAREVAERWGGQFPRTARELQSLPGIGRSTAAAIASLCHGERVAIMDGNVRRVVARVLAFDADLASASNQQALWAAAEVLLPARDLVNTMPRYTQGMMDLGAMICLPRQPVCGECPINGDCRARARGTPEAFPVRSRTLKRSSQSVWLLWATRPDGAVWLVKRPSRGVWSGLHCLPWFDAADTLLESVSPSQRSAAQELGVVKHVLTHKDLYLHPVRLPMSGNSAQGEGRWWEADAWPALGLPAPIRRLLASGLQPAV